LLSNQDKLRIRMACINSYHNSNINQRINKEKYRFQQKKSLIERKNVGKKNNAINNRVCGEYLSQCNYESFSST